MHRVEHQINIATNPSIATFIKHICNSYIVLPRLNLGVILYNTTTAINEEWLTAIEYLPTWKIFFKYMEQLLVGSYNICIYLKKTQTPADTYISLADIKYYLIKENNQIIAVDPIPELSNTLLHSFSEYRHNNVKTIELIAFSSQTIINDELIDKLTFLDITLFNKEYRNIKSIHSTQFETYNPFTVIAPSGTLWFFIESYPWINKKEYLDIIFNFLEKCIIEKISALNIVSMPLTKSSELLYSAYDPEKQIIFVKDIITRCLVTFFGCNCQLNTYHKFSLTKINTKEFLEYAIGVLKNIRKLY